MSRIGRLNNTWASDAPPDFGVFLKRRIALANLFSSNVPADHAPAISFFMFFTPASAIPSDCGKCGDDVPIEIPQSRRNVLNSAAANCSPLSDQNLTGAPTCVRNVRTASITRRFVVLVLGNFTTWGQPFNWSINTRKFWPFTSPMSA